MKISTHSRVGPESARHDHLQSTHPFLNCVPSIRFQSVYFTSLKSSSHSHLYIISSHHQVITTFLHTGQMRDSTPALMLNSNQHRMIPCEKRGIAREYLRQHILTREPPVDENPQLFQRSPGGGHRSRFRKAGKHGRTVMSERNTAQCGASSTAAVHCSSRSAAKYRPSAAAPGHPIPILRSDPERRETQRFQDARPSLHSAHTTRKPNRPYICQCAVHALEIKRSADHPRRSLQDRTAAPVTDLLILAALGLPASQIVASLRFSSHDCE
ncbi:hypothetical protein BJ912DRAFT_490189 [Pholiota molesta]|nr:hypothetical protein BJ912DRAFT_490189 [Pholiota molesta]